MNSNAVSPYIRTAMFSTLIHPFVINERVLYDYEIIFVSRGKCKITIDGTPYICRKNDVVFLRPGVPHKFETVENSDFVQPHIHFDLLYNDKSEETPVSFKNKTDMSDYELSLIQEDILKDKKIPCVFVPQNIDEFQKKLFEIINLFQEKHGHYELLYKAKLLELLSIILSQFEDGAASNTEQAHSLISSVKNYIDNNFHQIITLDALSKLFYINKFTLLRSFKLYYGQSIISYYRTKRIEFAKNILETTNISIAAIGAQLNFSDIYSFSRFFKMHVGCSPNTYRKNN